VNTRPLGRTGLQVSEIGFGGWAIGGNAFVDFGLTPQDVAELRQRLADVVRGQAAPAVFDESHSSLRH